MFWNYTLASVEKTYLAAQIPQRTNCILRPKSFWSLFLSPILEAESGCKGKATFPNFQIFLKKNFQHFFFENHLPVFEAESGCKGKASFWNFQIFSKKTLTFFENHLFHLLEAKAVAKIEHIFETTKFFWKKFWKIFKNHFLRSEPLSDLIASAK